jgi:hypothetical protein
MAGKIESGQNINALERAKVTRTEKYRQELLDDLKHPKRGTLNRQALADLAEARFADNEEMAKQAKDVIQERIYKEYNEPIDENTHHYYGGVIRMIEGAVNMYHTYYVIGSDNPSKAKAVLEFEQKLVEIVTQEVTDQDHPQWRSSRLIRARQPQPAERSVIEVAPYK